MQIYDYIILGGGAAGLSLAYMMNKDPFFLNKKIVIFEKEQKNTNDRTWSYWESNKGSWDHLLTKKWRTIHFAGSGYDQRIDIQPYTYKCIRSSDFYDDVNNELNENTSIEIRREEVIRCKDVGNLVEVVTKKGQYKGLKVFSSISFQNYYKKQQTFPVLNQHFIGWFIKVNKPIFTDDVATFMDFNIPQKGNTRFMYILPFSKTEALFEYTLFSESLLPREEYESEIKAYLNKIRIIDYSITEKEQGCIPMTSYDFAQHNTNNLIFIGTVGGWTKASTGFTFQNTMNKNRELLSFLKQSTVNFKKFNKKNRFWLYDLLFLDVLYQKNERGAELFTKLFQRNKPTVILKFLEEKTNFWEELKIMSSMPSGLFTATLLKRILRVKKRFLL